MRPVHQPSSSSLSLLPIFSKLQVWGGCRNVEFKKCSWKIRLWKMMKSYFVVKQKSAPTSAEIERITVFPDLRVMLHSTTAAPGKLWSLSTSKASRTPQKQNIRPDPLEMKPSSSAWWSNHPQTARVRWDCPFFPSSPLLQTAGATCSSSSSVSWTSPSSPPSSPTASQRMSLIFDNATLSSDSASDRPQQLIWLQVVLHTLAFPRHGALECKRRRGEGPSQQGEVLIIVIGRNDQLKCCQRHDLSPLTHPQEFDGAILPDIHPYPLPSSSPGSPYEYLHYLQINVQWLVVQFVNLCVRYVW